MKEPVEEPRDIYHRTLDSSVRIVRLSRELQKNGGICRNLATQVFKSGTSIGANLEEGRSGESRADFTHKYGIALKEARETLYWLKLIARSEVLPTNRLTDLTNECDEIVAVLTSIIKKTKQGNS